MNTPVELIPNEATSAVTQEQASLQEQLARSNPHRRPRTVSFVADASNHSVRCSAAPSYTCRRVRSKRRCRQRAGQTPTMRRSRPCRACPGKRLQAPLGPANSLHCPVDSHARLRWPALARIGIYDPTYTACVCTTLHLRSCCACSSQSCSATAARSPSWCCRRPRLCWSASAGRYNSLARQFNLP